MGLELSRADRARGCGVAGFAREPAAISSAGVPAGRPLPLMVRPWFPAGSGRRRGRVPAPSSGCAKPLARHPRDRL